MICEACYIATHQKAWYWRYVLTESGRRAPLSGLLFLKAWSELWEALRRVEGCTCMAKKAAERNKDWKGFANVAFDAQARAAYETADLTATHVYAVLEDLIGDGYRVTFSYDKANDAFQCSVTCQNEGKPEFGYTLTARGPSWFDALCVMVFKHETLAKGVWPLSEKTQGDKWG